MQVGTRALASLHACCAALYSGYMPKLSRYAFYVAGCLAGLQIFVKTLTGRKAPFDFEPHNTVSSARTDDPAGAYLLLSTQD